MGAKSNPNTPALWDKLLFENNEILLNSPFYLDKIKYVISKLKTVKGIFLDIGFGAGNLEKEIIRKNLDLSLYGVDISTKAVREAKNTLRGNFFVAKAVKMPFKTSFFDAVAILDVLEHLYKSDSLRVLNEISRVLKKGGLFIVSVPINEDLRQLNEENQNLNQHLREYSFEILKKELITAGFSVLDKKLIYGFRTHYRVKSLIVKFLPGFRKPNLLLVSCVKI
jgi:ubiquinone/menaquinone biosynthesis C-methylase UbiE